MAARKYILINDHSSDAPGEYGTVLSIPAETPSHLAVEKWQREHWRTAYTGRPQACSWKVSEAANMIDALSESCRRC